MKTLFKILLGVVLMLVLSAIGGYFYARKKFAPPANQLTVAGLPASGALQWRASTSLCGRLEDAVLELAHDDRCASSRPTLRASPCRHVRSTAASARHR